MPAQTGVRREGMQAALSTSVPDGLTPTDPLTMLAMR